MSYILDALRKADAQRERDPVRGIHAQALPPAGASPAQRLGSARVFWLTGGATAAALLLAAGWYVHARVDSSQPPPATAGVPAHKPALKSAAPPISAGLVPAAAAQPRAGRGETPVGHSPDARSLPWPQQLAQMEGPRTARGAAAGTAGAPPPVEAPAPMPAAQPAPAVPGSAAPGSPGLPAPAAP